MDTSPSASAGGGAEVGFSAFDGGTTTVISSSPSLAGFLVDLSLLLFLSLLSLVSLLLLLPLSIDSFLLCGVLPGMAASVRCGPAGIRWIGEMGEFWIR
jgi:hypothetical protein